MAESKPHAADNGAMSMPTPRLARPDLIEAFRNDLVASDYTVDHIGQLLGPTAASALLREQPTMAKRVLSRSDDPAAMLVLFFTLGTPMSDVALNRAFGALGVDGLVELGLAVPSDEPGTFEAACDVRPYGQEDVQWWLASDLSEIATGEKLDEEHVLGIGGASTTLAAWTVRSHRTRALDLGTGCGIQAVHLSQHVDEIVATDISKRALDFVAFNAALNRVTLDVRAGSMLEPVAGEQFDLIVSNPPFVITPRTDDMPGYEYRDGGAVGDAIVRNLVRDVAEHLTPGGVAQFLGNWELKDGESFEDVWARWLDGVELDAWVVQREVQDIAQYAELWARDGGSPVGSAEYDAMYASWINDFESRKVEHIGFGVVTLHKPATGRERFVDLMDERGPVAAAMGPVIEAGLDARIWLAEHTDDEVLDVHWTAAADVTEERHTKPGATDPSIIMIRQGGGFGLSIQADTVLAALMSVCDGSMSARTALVAIASIVGVDESEAITKTLPLLKKLVANGLLVQDDQA